MTEVVTKVKIKLICILGSDCPFYSIKRMLFFGLLVDDAVSFLFNFVLILYFLFCYCKYIATVLPVHSLYEILLHG